MRRSPSALLAAGPAYFEHLHAMYRADPASVDESWRAVFVLVDDLLSGEPPNTGTALPVADALRQSGHLIAAVNPLGSVGERALSHPDAAGVPKPVDLTDPAYAGLREAYLGALSIETGHIDDPAVRGWLFRAMEASEGLPDADSRRRALRELIRAEEFERFLGNKAPTKKRFGAEGAEAVLPLLAGVIRSAVAQGVDDIVIATMHRGRLNIMVNVLEQDPVDSFYAFMGNHPFPGHDHLPADVPYHLGLERELEIDGRKVRVSLCANPSHLEAVNPVGLGRVRARQDQGGRHGRDPRQTLGIVLHTDASVIGQGSVSEVVQLAGLQDFGTQGTIHIIINNQIGFTTDPVAARSSLHCSGLWKAVDSAIIHVNGDDPDAVLRAAGLAATFRQSHSLDAVIDLVCYRRKGHNELDEPTFTQPRLYNAIERMTPVAASYVRRLVAEGLVTDAEVSSLRQEYCEHLQLSYSVAGAADRSDPAEARQARSAEAPHHASTGVPVAEVERLFDAMAVFPDGLAVHPKVRRLLTQRSAGAPLNWAQAEALAFGSLLSEGKDVRLSGQDVQRGAFSTRHFVLHDLETGAQFNRLQAVATGGARFDIINSPLSENAVLGFEYGYSVERPDALVVWEAQFGDFANCAQVIIDQFITSGEEKWLVASGLTVLLPHGLEGQGPEHSSARIERLLQLCANENLRLVNPSTPANFFHLLRSQMHATRRRPLFVLSPKTLLRLPEAVSTVEEFGPDKVFLPVIPDTLKGPARRVVICSGKLAYALAKERRARGDDGVAIVRLEQMYPFPAFELAHALAPHAQAEIVWAQEEPVNMGGWTWLDRRIEGVLSDIGAAVPRPSVIARHEAASPAGSFHGAHDADQMELIERAFEQRSLRREEAA